MQQWPLGDLSHRMVGNVFRLLYHRYSSFIGGHIDNIVSSVFMIWIIQACFGAIFYCLRQMSVPMELHFSSFCSCFLYVHDSWGAMYISTKMRIFMMTSSNGNIFRVTDPLCGEFTGHRLWCFFDLCLDKRLSKNRKAGDLRRHRAHYDVIVMLNEAWKCPVSPAFWSNNLLRVISGYCKICETSYIAVWSSRLHCFNPVKYSTMSRDMVGQFRYCHLIGENINMIK